MQLHSNFACELDRVTRGVMKGQNLEVRQRIIQIKSRKFVVTESEMNKI